MNTKVLNAVFKRNFIGYFSNPTGYVFICVFVLLSSIAAFLPDEFFNANLANLDQLNIWFPLITLVFVPAITMGIWADERRQGTDELLLTIPASDFDIVIGKYCAAVSIYTVSLLFSMVCNMAILRFLGSPDAGLFFCTYFGYWLVGVAMIAIGMVASFLTANLTVSYILGTLCCAPFIAFQWTDVIVPSDRFNIVQIFKSFSIAQQFDLFGRGIVSFSAILYFAVIAATMVYLSVVLIGRRHWTANQSFFGTLHYSVRSASLLVIGLSLCFIFRHHNDFGLRADFTEEKLSTLSRHTVQLLKELTPEHPIIVEAFVSADMPDSHAQTRHDIISILKEIEAICGKKVSVQIHQIEPSSDQALIINQRYSIKPQEISFAVRGKREIKTVFLSIVFRSGLQTMTLPFIDRGLSVEYELVRGLCSVVTPKKKRIGILKTDVPLFGRFNMSTFSVDPTWQVVEELQKQYTVIEVDPAEPIFERYDALVAIQPSAMGQSEINNFIEAVASGQPTVIFEDPMPAYIRSVPGTGEPRQPPSQMMMMMQRMPPPKGSIHPLWDLLGVSVDERNAVWQEYSPIRKIPGIPKGFVFLDRNPKSKEAENKKPLPFNRETPVTSALQYMMLPFPGRLMIDPRTPLEVTPLLQTFQQPAGIIATRAIGSSPSWEKDLVVQDRPNDLAVRIKGELPAPPAPPVAEGEKPIKPEPIKIDVLLVADIDMLSDAIFNLRRMGNEPGAGIDLNFDNVTFVLNAIDSIAGDERFLSVRTRRPKHRTLSKFDERTDEVRANTSERRDQLKEKYRKEQEAAEAAMNAKLEDLKKQLASGGLSEEEAQRKWEQAQIVLIKQLAALKESLEREYNLELEKAEYELNKYVNQVQGMYKFGAVAIPPIPPLVVAMLVYVVRKIRESESVPQTRRKK